MVEERISLVFSRGRKAVLGELRDRVQALERAGFATAAGLENGGIRALDGAEIDAGLPWGGLPRGALHEVAGRRDGAAAGFAAALLARLGGHTAADGADGRAETVLWCQTSLEAHEAGALHGPGMAAFGLDRCRLIVLGVRRPVDLLWAMEEGLRCPGVGAVLGEVDEIDLRASRRLQLAAEAGGAAGLLLRPRLDDLGVSAALTRWRVTPVSGPAGLSRPLPPRPIGASWAADLWRCRGGAPRRWKLEWDEQAFRFAVVPALADGSADAGAQALSA